MKKDMLKILGMICLLAAIVFAIYKLGNYNKQKAENELSGYEMLDTEDEEEAEEEVQEDTEETVEESEEDEENIEE